MKILVYALCRMKNLLLKHIAMLYELVVAIGGSVLSNQPKSNARVMVHSQQVYHFLFICVLFFGRSGGKMGCSEGFFYLKIWIYDSAS